MSFYEYGAFTNVSINGKFYQNRLTKSFLWDIKELKKSIIEVADILQ